jgi:putative transposase
MVKEEMGAFRETMKGELGAIYFNGSYSRDMKAPLGMIKDVPIPRFRDNAVGYTPQSLGVFSEQEDQFMKLVSEMHRLGVSQRKVAGIAKSCFGITLSANRVGHVYRDLAEREEATINTRPLSDIYQYLYLDGVWVHTKGYGWDNNKSVLLCALGVTKEGKREIIGFTVADSESYDNWHNLILSLKKRGMMGTKLELAISDGAEGLIGAIHHLFPDLRHQTCILHKMRNVLSAASHKNKEQLGNDLKVAYNQPNIKQALLSFQSLTKRWYLEEPEAIKRLKHNLQSTLTYFELPQQEWSRVRTNNILEREFRELRRRINVMDSSFNDAGSASRYAATTFSYLNQNYPASRGGLHTNA